MDRICHMCKKGVGTARRFVNVKIIPLAGQEEVKHYFHPRCLSEYEARNRTAKLRQEEKALQK